VSRSSFDAPMRSLGLLIFSPLRAPHSSGLCLEFMKGQGGSQQE
jgi:hypothetical protein